MPLERRARPFRGGEFSARAVLARAVASVVPGSAQSFATGLRYDLGIDGRPEPLPLPIRPESSMKATRRSKLAQAAFTCYHLGSN
jgi:hypothetical protein